jgi:hypothetical protein
MIIVTNCGMMLPSRTGADMGPARRGPLTEGPTDTRHDAAGTVAQQDRGGRTAPQPTRHGVADMV